MSVNLNEVEDRKSSVIVVPGNVPVGVRFTEVTFVPENNSGNPMLTFEWEGVYPNQVSACKDAEGKECDGAFAGQVKGLFWLTWVGKDGIADFSKVKDLHKKLQLPMEFNPEMPDVDIYKGLIAKGLVRSELRERKDSNGNVIEDDLGNRLVNVNYTLGTVLGKYDESDLV